MGRRLVRDWFQATRALDQGGSGNERRCGTSDPGRCPRPRDRSRGEIGRASPRPAASGDFSQSRRFTGPLAATAPRQGEVSFGRTLDKRLLYPSAAGRDDGRRRRTTSGRGTRRRLPATLGAAHPLPSAGRRRTRRERGRPPVPWALRRRGPAGCARGRGFYLDAEGDFAVGHRKPPGRLYLLVQTLRTFFRGSVVSGRRGLKRFGEQRDRARARRDVGPHYYAGGGGGRAAGVDRSPQAVQ